MAIEDIRALKRQLMERIQNEGQGELVRLAREAMEKDGVEAIKWAQYTQSFNDGDPCYFSIYDVTIPGVDEQYPDDYDYFRGFITVDSDKYPNIAAFESVLNELEEIAEVTFGDGVSVQINKDGTVEVEEYDHD